MTDTATRAEQIERAELRRLAESLRELNRELEPLRRKTEENRRERMRMDGPRGFVMIHKDYSTPRPHTASKTS